MIDFTALSSNSEEMKPVETSWIPKSRAYKEYKSIRTIITTIKGVFIKHRTVLQKTEPRHHLDGLVVPMKWTKSLAEMRKGSFRSANPIRWWMDIVVDWFDDNIGHQTWSYLSNPINWLHWYEVNELQFQVGIFSEKSCGKTDCWLRANLSGKPRKAGATLVFPPCLLELILTFTFNRRVCKRVSLPWNSSAGRWQP